jgi:hypothetical protein
VPTVVRYGARHPYQTLAGSPFGIPRPMLGVRLIHGTIASPELFAIVDSGADVSTFHADVAGLVGLDLGVCRRAATEGVGGATAVFVCPIELEVAGRRFAAEVHFSSAIHSTVALLGRHDVFRQFQFGFDERGQVLLVEPY